MSSVFVGFGFFFALAAKVGAETQNVRNAKISHKRDKFNKYMNIDVGEQADYNKPRTLL